MRYRHLSRLRARWANLPKASVTFKVQAMTPRPTWLETYKIKKLLWNITAMQQRQWCDDGGSAGRVDWPRGQLDNKSETTIDVMVIKIIIIILLL